VLDVDALDRADPVGEHEHLGLGERRCRVVAAPGLPDERRVQALLDRRPDRERRREVVAAHHEVGAVAHRDLVDLGEQVVGGVAGEHVRQAGLDPDAEQRERARLAPLAVARELLVAELHPRQLVRPLGMRARQRHRHVQVGAARRPRRGEDRRVQARVAGVEDRVGALGAGEVDDGGLVARVQRDGPVPGIRMAGDRRPGTVALDVGEHQAVEEVAAARDGGDRGAAPAGAQDEDAHRAGTQR
jgi:hypothetical protein